MYYLILLSWKGTLSGWVVCNSFGPHGPQSARLLCPWGFSRQESWGGLSCPPPGDLPNPGIEPRSPMLQADSLPAETQRKPKNTGVGSLSLLQRIFPTQGSNPGLPHCRWILYQLSYKESSRILEWVAFPFSRGSSQPRNQTRVSCIAGRFFLPTELWGKPLLCTRFC